jgi:hypothetical protein
MNDRMPASRAMIGRMTSPRTAFPKFESYQPA